MIMGWSASGNWWPPELIHSLAQYYQVLIFDNRGAGRTDIPLEDYTIPMMAEDTVGLMKAVGIERAHVFGVSLGGMIAQEMALLYPGTVEKLILGCTHCGIQHFIPGSSRVTRFLDKGGFKSTDEILNETMSILFPRDFIEQNPELIEEVKRRHLTPPPSFSGAHRQFGAAQRFSSFDRLGKINAPTLVVTGDQDVVVPLENSEILASRIPGARLKILRGCGHSFVNQVPNQLSEVLKEFLG